MRKPIIAGNWKMFKTVSEAQAMVKELTTLVKGVEDREVLVCPTFTALAEVGKNLGGTNVALGAQNMYWEEKGAFTGEISPLMLKDVGCQYVILGHSERREYFGETNETVNKKVKTAFAYDLLPIVCVGERLAEREAGTTKEVLESQVRGSIANLSVELAEKLVVAYEPVWAIGTGKTASKEDAQEGIQFIRQVIVAMYGENTGKKVRIQYGGSVKGDNIAELMAQPDIDGALVGGAALEAKSFAAIVKGF